MKELYFTIKDGRIVPNKSDNVGYTIRHLKDGLYKLTLSKVGTRSNQSNRYYRGVVLQLIAEYTGQTKEELHEYFKQMFLYSEENSTTEKNQSDFGTYVDQIKAYALNELNIIIPDVEN